jgi:hypothetical protein
MMHFWDKVGINCKICDPSPFLGHRGGVITAKRKVGLYKIVKILISV